MVVIRFDGSAEWLLRWTRATSPVERVTPMMEGSVGWKRRSRTRVSRGNCCCVNWWMSLCSGLKVKKWRLPVEVAAHSVGGESECGEKTMLRTAEPRVWILTWMLNERYEDLSFD